jgi:hypothetical protein
MGEEEGKGGGRNVTLLVKGDEKRDTRSESRVNA